MRVGPIWRVLWSVVLLGGCGPGAIDVGSAAGGSDDTGAEASTTSAPGATSSTGTPQPGEDEGDVPPDPSDGPEPGDTGDPTDSDSGVLDLFEPPPDGLPDASACTVDAECASANCWLMPLAGGFCGECNEDVDCPAGGCTAPNPFDAIGSSCNAGELGGGCETDAACQPGLTCAPVLDVLGVLLINGCSECQTDADCEPGLLCTPVTSFADLSGARRCLPPNSLEHGSYCELEGAGDLHCASGSCAFVSVMGLFPLGSCGECKENGDCPDGEVCVEGTFDLDSGAQTGSTCE